MTLLVAGHSFAYEMECLLRMFLPPGEKIQITGDLPAGEERTAITRVEVRPDGKRLLTADAWGEMETETVCAQRSDQELEWALARLLYCVLSRQTGLRPPWGILTGVRPVRLFRQIAAELGSEEAARREMLPRYLITPEKLNLATETARIQEQLLTKQHPRGFSLYVSIPFCPSRCLYCSFVSHDIKGAAKLVPDYVQRVCEEIRLAGEIASRQGLVLQTVYVGGGTPTTLEPLQLEQILVAVEESFDHSTRLEYTVEAGRPDTITAEKLKVLSRMGVDRISINPQTMDDGMLRRIGRAHTAQQARTAFAMARQAGFANINMDLIAGLPGENGTAFGDSVEQILQMKPENVTVHTLTVKRSSRLREEGKAAEAPAPLSQWLDRESARLQENGYRPYYLYRQKGTVQNLENTGYSLAGREGLYNVLIMEETQTILAVGAGAVTKLCAPGKPLQRVYNYKYPHEYITRFPEMLARKQETEALLATMYENDCASTVYPKGGIPL